MPRPCRPRPRAVVRPVRATAGLVAGLAVAGLAVAGCATEATQTEQPAINGARATAGAVAIDDAYLAYATGPVSPTPSTVAAHGSSTSPSATRSTSPRTSPSTSPSTSSRSGLRLFFAIANNGGHADTLTGISVRGAPGLSVSLPAKGITVASGDVALFESPTASVAVTAGAGSSPLPIGAGVSLTFDFSTAGPITVGVPVESAYGEATTPDSASPLPSQ